MAEILTEPMLQEQGDASESERILFFPEPCTRSTGDACERCSKVCPTGAVTIAEDNAIVIDSDACTLCGICIGICDCFASSRITTFDHAKRMVRKAQRSGSLYLCCKEDCFDSLEPADNVVILGCLSAVSPEFLTYVLSTNTNVVICHDFAYCEHCERGGRFGGKLWQRSFSLAEEWSGKQLSYASVIPEKEHFAEKMAAPDRRSLFTGAVGALGEVASGQYRERKSTVVEEFLARQERMRAKLNARPDEGMYLGEDARHHAKESRFARRLLLDAAIANDPSITSRVPDSTKEG